MSGNESAKKKNRKQVNDDGEVTDLTKEEKEIARFLRLKCPKRQGNLVGMKVDFFIANKLVDCLMSSKWGPGNPQQQQNSKSSGKQPYLVSRSACIQFMQRLMNKQLFYRAVKVYKEQPKEANTSGSTESNVRKRKTKETTGSSTETPQPSSSSNSSPSQQQKDNQTKKKFKLEMHEDQKFIDSAEPYVWVYDPTTTKTYIIGLLLILGAIGVCLFPLWPSQVREGVYYLSLTGAGFLGFIIGLALFKYVLFAFIWAITFGKVHFWLFPNLTEDVGFFESFVPIYKCNLNSSQQTTTTTNATATTEPINSVDESKTDDLVENTNEPVKTSENTALTSSTHSVVNQIDQEDAPLITTTKELSKSTLEISTTRSRDSPSVRNNKKVNNNANINEEDDFELVNDDQFDQ